MSLTDTPDGLAANHDTDPRGAAGLKHVLGDIATDAAKLVRHGAHELRHEAEATVAAAKHSLHDAESAGADAAASLKNAIVKNPITSLGIAAGIGLVVGLLVFRPRS
ncbi:MAG: DUF883 domain-containing protein [Phycisphaerales bacterium]